MANFRTASILLPGAVSSDQESYMRRFAAVICAALFACSSFASAQSTALVDVYKSPTCGCCSKWIDHLRASGFSVRSVDVADVDRIKDSRGVPRQVRSCHMAIVGGYVVEGHVPAADVKRLLKERPAIVGIAVPGMPIGSPGMEVPGVKAQAYDVVAFMRDGSTRVFAKH
jgi:hypothetical protein